KFFHYLDAQMGMQNVLVVLTADHGVAPLPELSMERSIGGGRMPAKAVQDAVQANLDERFGKAKWILSVDGEGMYLDQELMRQKKLNAGEVESVAANAARGVPHVARVFTRDQLVAGRSMADPIGRRVRN